MRHGFDPDKLADVQNVADKLSGLPKDALLYIAGYAEGRRDAPKKRKSEKPPDTPDKKKGA